VGIASFGADRLGWRSIYIDGLRRRGVTLDRPDDLDVLQMVAVREVMTPADQHHITVPADESVDELRERFRANALHGAVVVDTSGRLVGVVARVDLDRTGGTAGELATARVATAVPDEPVFRAVQRMANLDVGRLPVVDPTSGRVVGVFRRADVVRAYDRGIERSLTAQMTRDSGRLRDITGLQAVQVLVAAASRVDGALVSEVRWPERTILTGVRRGTQAIVPDGSTRLQADDLVVALTAHPDELREIVATPEQAAAEATTDPSDELHT